MGTPRNIWALGWVSFFTDLATAMSRPLIPIYVVLALKEGTDKLGLILAVTTVVSYALRWVGGYLSDRLAANKGLLVVGYGLSAIMKPLMSLATGWQTVAFFSAAERLGKAIRSAPKDALISASAQKKAQGRAFGVHKTLDIAGETLGGLIAFALLYSLGHAAGPIRQIFALTLIPGVLGVLVLLLFVADVKRPAPAAPRGGAPERREPEQGLFGWYAVYFAALFFMMNEALMLVRGSEVGIATDWLPLFVVGSGLTQTVTSYPLGRWVDRHGARWPLLGAVLAGTLSMLCLMQSHAALVAAAFLLQGVFTVAGLNAIRARIGQGRQQKGKAYGALYLGTAGATALGNLLLSQLWERVGSHAAIWLSAGGLLVPLLIALWPGVLASGKGRAS